MTYQQKIEYSIDLIRKSEKLALQYNDFGYHLAFSGGKDSQVIYELCKIAGVKFKAFFHKTSVDPPELLQFIRDNYPDVIWLKPEMTIYQLILKKSMLPMRQQRFCCEVIKERNGLNAVTIIGIRKAESTKRSKRKEFTQDCKLGQDKILLSPILDWKDREIWNFLEDRNIKVCSLYKIFSRIGCIGCPMNPKKQRLEFRTYPNFKIAYLNTIKKLIAQGKYLQFENAEDVLNWWTSGISRKKYMANKKQLKIKYL